MRVRSTSQRTEPAFPHTPSLHRACSAEPSGYQLSTCRLLSVCHATPRKRNRHVSESEPSSVVGAAQRTMLSAQCSHADPTDGKLSFSTWNNAELFYPFSRCLPQQCNAMTHAWRPHSSAGKCAPHSYRSAVASSWIPAMHAPRSRPRDGRTTPQLHACTNPAANTERMLQ